MFETSTKEVFVTIMYRYGDREGHSYLIGVFESFEDANLAGEKENSWRGGKYDPEIYKCILNADYSESGKFEYELIKALDSESIRRHFWMRMNQYRETIDDEQFYHGA